MYWSHISDRLHGQRASSNLPSAACNFSCIFSVLFLASWRVSPPFSCIISWVSSVGFPVASSISLLLSCCNHAHRSLTGCSDKGDDHNFMTRCHSGHAIWMPLKSDFRPILSYYENKIPLWLCWLRWLLWLFKALKLICYYTIKVKFRLDNDWLRWLCWQSWL